MAAIASFAGLPSTSSAAFSPGNKSTPKSPPSSLKLQSLESSWLGSNLRLQLSNSRSRNPSRRAASLTAESSLPISNPEKLTSTEKPLKWSANAIRAFAMAELESKKLRYKITGSELFIAGILIGGTSLAARYLLSIGITPSKLRQEILKFRGEGYMFFRGYEHAPLTEDAKKVLDTAVDLKIKSGEGGEITTTDLLLAIWAVKVSPGQRILGALGFTDGKANELKSLSSKLSISDG